MIECVSYTSWVNVAQRKRRSFALPQVMQTFEAQLKMLLFSHQKRASCAHLYATDSNEGILDRKIHAAFVTGYFLWLLAGFDQVGTFVTRDSVRDITHISSLDTQISWSQIRGVKRALQTTTIFLMMNLFHKYLEAMDELDDLHSCRPIKQSSHSAAYAQCHKR